MSCKEMEKQYPNMRALLRCSDLEYSKDESQEFSKAFVVAIFSDDEIVEGHNFSKSLDYDCVMFRVNGEYSRPF